ncbi:hypothetical protein GQ42DRAFT_177860 [Ramicandelaber brevisporus]|nr:hypothetical protein GQ42DRAFT_177860 [Ramicandelaber brevisporus]
MPLQPGMASAQYSSPHGQFRPMPPSPQYSAHFQHQQQQQQQQPQSHNPLQKPGQSGFIRPPIHLDLQHQQQHPTPGIMGITPNPSIVSMNTPGSENGLAITGNNSFGRQSFRTSLDSGIQMSDSVGTGTNQQQQSRLTGLHLMPQSPVSPLAGGGMRSAIQTPQTPTGTMLPGSATGPLLPEINRAVRRTLSGSLPKALPSIIGTGSGAGSNLSSSTALARSALHTLDPSLFGAIASMPSPLTTAPVQHIPIVINSKYIDPSAPEMYSSSVVNRLVNIFFQAYRFEWLLDKKSLLARMKTGTMPEIELNALLATNCRYANFAEINGISLESAAQVFITNALKCRDNALINPSIENIHGFLSIGYYLCSLSETGEGSENFFHAHELAMRMKLHLLDEDSTRHAFGGSHSDEFSSSRAIAELSNGRHSAKSTASLVDTTANSVHEMSMMDPKSRKLWWTVMVIDLLTSIPAGIKPRLSIAQCKVNLPLNEFFFTILFPPVPAPVFGLDTTSASVQSGGSASDTPLVSIAPGSASFSDPHSGTASPADSTMSSYAAASAAAHFGLGVSSLPGEANGHDSASITLYVLIDHIAEELHRRFHTKDQSPVASSEFVRLNDLLNGWFTMLPEPCRCQADSIASVFIDDEKECSDFINLRLIYCCAVILLNYMPPDVLERVNSADDHEVEMVMIAQRRCMVTALETISLVRAVDIPTYCYDPIAGFCLYLAAATPMCYIDALASRDVALQARIISSAEFAIEFLTVSSDHWKPNRRFARALRSSLDMLSSYSGRLRPLSTTATNQDAASAAVGSGIAHVGSSTSGGGGGVLGSGRKSPSSRSTMPASGGDTAQGGDVIPSISSPPTYAQLHEPSSPSPFLPRRVSTAVSGTNLTAVGGDMSEPQTPTVPSSTSLAASASNHSLGDGMSSSSSSASWRWDWVNHDYVAARLNDSKETSIEALQICKFPLKPSPLHDINLHRRPHFL